MAFLIRISVINFSVSFFICSFVPLSTPISPSEKQGGWARHIEKKGVYYVLFLAIRNLGTFRITVNARSGRCLRGMFIPSLCTSLGGRCAGVLYIHHRRGLLRNLFTVMGFLRPRMRTSTGTDSHVFSFYMLLNLHELTNSGSGESAGIKETNR